VIRVADLFAGWGGFSLGAQRAGCEVVYAANHSPLAVEVHSRNHPHTVHECQDLRQADFTQLPPYDLLLASPACQGNSRASQPRRRRYHDAMRATAWAVVDCAEVTEPKAIIVENVPDLRRWCLYQNWCGALRTLGYHVAEHIVQASRLGVPQRRLRLMITATRRPIVRLDLPCLDELPFEPCIDSGAAGWRLVRAAPAPVQERIARGRARLGRRFLSQHVTGHRGVPLDEPIRTITTKNHWLLVDGDVYRGLTERELARGMALPDTFAWPATTGRNEAICGIGNAVPPPMAEHVVRAVLEAA
jgi:DNA (cytosine-5)-methyltransferase 1